MATAVISSRGTGFYEKIILHLLEKMNKDRLRLRLPSGEELQFGNSEEGISARIEIKSPEFFKRCILYGDIGFGESYTENEWESENVTDVIKWFLLNIENAPGLSGSRTKSFFINILKILNRIGHRQRSNTRNGSKTNISDHYDLNNDFFALFLDPSMTYSAAWFNRPGLNLHEAQMAKYDRLCQQLKLEANDQVLEIGSGWGANAIYMAKNYGCNVTSLTISEEQYKYVLQRIKEEGLEDKVKILLQDYREIRGQYDKIVSIEMLEAVGAEYYETYFIKCADLLKKDGILAIQVITCPDSRFAELKRGVDWIQKHIFPGSLLPSVAAINKAINKTSDLSLVDLKDIGPDYALTLRAWHEQFSRNIHKVKAYGFDDYFVRKWQYYFSYCEAAFEMRNIGVMQLVYSRPNNLRRP